MRRVASHGFSYFCTSTHTCPVGTGEQAVFGIIRAEYMNNGELQVTGVNIIWAFRRVASALAHEVLFLFFLCVFLLSIFPH